MKKSSKKYFKYHFIFLATIIGFILFHYYKSIPSPRKNECFLNEKDECIQIIENHGSVSSGKLYVNGKIQNPCIIDNKWFIGEYNSKRLKRTERCKKD